MTSVLLAVVRAGNDERAGVDVLVRGRRKIRPVFIDDVLANRHERRISAHEGTSLPGLYTKCGQQKTRRIQTIHVHILRVFPEIH